MPANEVASGVLMLIGAFFILVACIGVVRLPDVYMRMAATSKAATLGAACTVLSVALFFFDDLGVVTRALVTILFVFATVPIGAHMIGRAAYIRHLPLWKGAVIDELAGCYDEETFTFASKPLTNQSPAPPAESGAATPPPQSS